MRKVVTCPEWGRQADIETFEGPYDRVAFVAHCSLWEDDEILETCRDTCAHNLNVRRAQRDCSQGKRGKNHDRDDSCCD